MEEPLPLGLTGFRAVLCDGKVVHEVNGALRAEFGALRATNWTDVPLDRLISLELIFQGKRVAAVNVNEIQLIHPSDWYFSHTAVMDSKTWRSVVQYRNIGYYLDGVLHLWRMHEVTGSVHTERLADCRR